MPKKFDREPVAWITRGGKHIPIFEDDTKSLKESLSKRQQQKLKDKNLDFLLNESPQKALTSIDEGIASNLDAITNKEIINQRWSEERLDFTLHNGGVSDYYKWFDNYKTQREGWIARYENAKKDLLKLYPKLKK